MGRRTNARQVERQHLGYVIPDHHEILAEVIPPDAPLRWSQLSKNWRWEIGDVANTVVHSRTLAGMVNVIEYVRDHHVE